MWPPNIAVQLRRTRLRHFLWDHSSWAAITMIHLLTPFGWVVAVQLRGAGLL
jgi:hypothetical protein